MRLFGLFLIALATLLPIYWYAGLMPQRDAGALFSQYLGSAALILMGINQFLATRTPGLETLFGPLDRIYVLHKWLGVIAMVMLGLHDIIDAEMDGLAAGALSDAAEEFGEVSLYGLLILVIASIITFIPYHLWKWTHRFIGVFFALGAFHYFFIEKPFQNADPLGLYITAFCLLGLASYLYMLVIRPWLPTGHRYTVSSVRKFSGVTEVSLAPKGRGLKHKAGQFAFLAVKSSGLREEHPFTLSAAPETDRSLRFSIKELGDYTSRLGHELEEGAEAVVTGPFGHFTMASGRDPQVWIGAGIGVTPFLSFARAADKAETGPIHLYYCVREDGEVPYAAELDAAAAGNANLTVTILNSAKGERLNANRIAADLGSGLSSAHVYFCGPKAMRQSLKGELAAKGARASRFHYEEFEMRSGIGLRKLAAWLFDGLFLMIAKRKAVPAE